MFRNCIHLFKAGQWWTPGLKQWFWCKKLCIVQWLRPKKCKKSISKVNKSNPENTKIAYAMCSQIHKNGGRTLTNQCNTLRDWMNIYDVANESCDKKRAWLSHCSSWQRFPMMLIVRCKDTRCSEFKLLRFFFFCALFYWINSLSRTNLYYLLFNY